MISEARLLAMPTLLYVLAGLVLMIAGYYTPTEVKNSCMEYFLYPQRPIIVVLSCFSLVLSVKILQFDGIKILILLSLMAILMFLLDPDFVDYGDLGEATGLQSNSCIHSGMIFVFCAWGFALFATETVKFFSKSKDG